MTNERRLIDSAELIAKLPIVEEDKQISLIGAVADVVTMISECKPVDAVEVVRCEECKYREDCVKRIEFMGRNLALELNTHEYHPLKFCSYGERKEG